MTQPAQDPVGAPDATGDAETASAIARLAEQINGLHAAIAALDRLAMSRVDAMAEKAALALAAADKAALKAETAVEKRFEGVNEFRAALSDQAINLITRAEARSLADRNAERIDELVEWRNRAEGILAGARDSRETGKADARDGRAAILAVIALASMVIAALSLVLR
jgi:hypothetical protein